MLSSLVLAASPPTGEDSVFFKFGQTSAKTKRGLFFSVLFNMMKFQCFIHFLDLHFSSQTPMEHLHMINCAKGKKIKAQHVSRKTFSLLPLDKMLVF